MFRKLHTHFVLTAMSLLTIVLVVSFSAIYVSTAARLRAGPGMMRPLETSIPSERFSSSDFREFIEQQRKADADKTLRELAITLVLTGAATLAAGYFVSRYLADRAIRPVEEAYERQRQFVADASHELKTPLAVIDANIEAELIDAKRPSKWLQTIQDETEQMNKLVTDLLSLAQLDTTATPPRTEFDVSDVVEKTLRATEPLAEARRLTVTKELSSQLLVVSNEAATRQIVTILIDNAIKHTRKSGAVAVKTVQGDRRAIVSVANTHVQIPEDRLAQLFDRFYQADESRHSGGHGLGLAIARSAAQTIGADLTVHQNAGEITFTLALPLEG